MKGNKKGNKKPAKKGKSVRSLWDDVRKSDEDREKDKAICELGQQVPQATVTFRLSPNPEAAPTPALGPDPFGFNLDAVFKKIDSAIYTDSGAKPAEPKAVTGSRVKYYWQYVDADGNGSGPSFMITPKEHFDAEGTLYDGHFDEGDLPPGFHNLMESTFEFDGTRKAAETLLRANQIFEEKEMFHE
jgi:hypothetical protein